jgi:hypothetical protein
MTAVVKYKTSTKDNLIECTEGTVTNVLKLDSTTGATIGAMTVSPEITPEDGYLTIDIGGTSYQIPVYAA